MKIAFTLFGVPREDWVLTNKLLLLCMEVGYTAITISTKNNIVPHSNCGGLGKSYEICTFPNIHAGHPDWGGCAIWEILRKCNIEMLVGNYQQAQIRRDNRLIEGAYELTNNKWKKIQ